MTGEERLAAHIERLARIRRTVASKKRRWWGFAAVAPSAHVWWAFASGHVVHLQRGGAMLTIFAFFMLFFTKGLPEQVRDTIDAALADLPTKPAVDPAGVSDALPDAVVTRRDRLAQQLDGLRRELLRTQVLADMQNLHIAMIGALGTTVWGYADLLACVPCLGLRGCP